MRKESKPYFKNVLESELMRGVMVVQVLNQFEQTDFITFLNFIDKKLFSNVLTKIVWYKGLYQSIYFHLEKGNDI